jgi:hypothetical protein
MNSFVDDTGRTWGVRINCWTCMRVEEATGLYIPSLIDDDMKGLRELLYAPVPTKLMGVIYHLCREEADKQGISESSFLSSMGGEAMRGARTAFESAFCDFFPEPAQRATLRQAFDLMKTLGEKMAAKAKAEMDSINPDLLVNTSGASFVDVPASSVSAPAPPARSGNSSSWKKQKAVKRGGTRPSL